jgi:hypothetical protein
MAQETGRCFPPRKRVCHRVARMPRHCLAGAHWLAAAQRRGRGLGRARLCTEFSTEIVETAAETFAGAWRRADVPAGESLAECRNERSKIR